MANHLRLMIWIAWSALVAGILVVAFSSDQLGSTWSYIRPALMSCSDLGGRDAVYEDENGKERWTCLGVRSPMQIRPALVFSNKIEKMEWEAIMAARIAQKEVLENEAKKIVCQIRGDLCDGGPAFDPAWMEHY